jgi:formylglycine-generating enzyme required for sulfatase activity
MGRLMSKKLQWVRTKVIEVGRAVLTKAVSELSKKDGSPYKIGERLDRRYEVESIEEHELAYIYRVFNINDRNEKSIVKYWKDSERERELLNQEIKITDLLKNPNPSEVPYLRQQSPEGGYIIREYIDGNLLSEEVNTEIIFDSEKTINLIKELCNLIKPIHNRGIVHCRIEPKHIIRNKKGKLFLLDFSESQQINIKVDRKKRIKTDFTPRSFNDPLPELSEDIYSIGIIAVLALTRVKNLDVLGNKREHGGTLAWSQELGNATPELIEVVNKMIDETPQIRYQNVGEVLAAIENLPVYLNPASHNGNQPTIPQVPSQPSSNTTERSANLYQSQPELETKLQSPDISRKLLPTMVTIKSGSFVMGSDRRSERPRHQVSISSFQMSATPITQSQWRHVMGSNSIPSYHQGDNYPVESIDWLQAQEFCKRLSSLSQDDKTYRLPTEAEWEYACKANTDTKFYFGDDIDSTQVNYGNNRNSHTEVSSFAPNYFGLYDMHGNVWEWCEDSYRTGYENAPNNGNAVTKEAEAENDEKVVRGGAWNTGKDACATTYRYYIPKNESHKNCGFRVVCDM